MTRQQALKAWSALRKGRGLNAEKSAVKMTPNGGRIGQHGEFVKSHVVSNKKESPKHGRYRCDLCSSIDMVDGDVIDRHVYHVAGGFQSSYALGVVFLGFFTVEFEGDSFESVLAQAQAAIAAADVRKAAKAEQAATS